MKRFVELKDLYFGKKMHAKALQLLREYVSPLLYVFNSSQALYRLSERSTDIQDKLRPSIVYLQKLGPEYLDIIFKFSRWVFERDADMAFEVR